MKIITTSLAQVVSLQQYFSVIMKIITASLTQVVSLQYRHCHNEKSLLPIQHIIAIYFEWQNQWMVLWCLQIKLWMNENIKKWELKKES